MEERLKECLRLALEYNVSDIHFNVKDNDICIEMRIDSKIKKVKSNKDDIKLFRFIQYKSNIDIGNKVNAQTGSFEFEVDNKILSLRFSIINSYKNTNGVLRILNTNTSLKINDLSNDFKLIKFLKDITNHRNGLFIFSGPTGSGKTTTMYTILNEIKNKKIYTIEDPIEVFNENYIQLQINEKQNITYANGIKQLLRHDPDIIMIGEIRDDLAAKMAVRCALTGHLVLTSIHSSNCVNAINRLIELGVNKFQLFDVLKGISNQRLYKNLNNNSRIGVYEFMDYKEIEYYLKNDKTSENFKSIVENIKNEIYLKNIDSEEAIQDTF